MVETLFKVGSAAVLQSDYNLQIHKLPALHTCQHLSA